MPELKQALDEQPEVWRRGGDLARLAEEAWLRLAAGPDLLLHEGLRRTLARLKEDLAGPDPSPLETLLVGRVVACWLQLHHAEAIYAHAHQPTPNLLLLRELQQRQESAERRLHAALKQLALVRKLLRPAAAPLNVAGVFPVGGRLGRVEDACASLKDGVGVLN
jgi:hypothetical protein